MNWIEKVINMPVLKKAQFFILGIIAYDALLYNDLWIIAMVGILGVILWNCHENAACADKRFCFLDSKEDPGDK